MECILANKEEYDFLRSGSVLIDSSNNDLVIKVSGSDAQEFLDLVISKNVLYLQMNNSLDSVILDDNNNVLDFVSLLNNDECYYLIASKEKRENIISYFEGKQGNFDIEFEILEMSSYILAGPYSWRILQELVDDSYVGLPLLSFINFEIDEKEGILIRGGYTGDYGFKIIIPKDENNTIKNKILSSEFDYKEISTETHDILTSNFGNFSSFSFNNYIKNSFEFGFKHLIDFSKDDYIYHDKLNELSPKYTKSTVAFICDELPNTLSTTIVNIGDITGNIIYYSYSYHLEKYIGYILIDNKFAIPGLSFSTKESSQKLQTVSLPFYETKSFTVEIE